MPVTSGIFCFKEFGNECSGIDKQLRSCAEKSSFGSVVSRGFYAKARAKLLCVPGDDGMIEPDRLLAGKVNIVILAHARRLRAVTTNFRR